MSVRCRTIIELMEKIAPLYLAESWDNVGFQIGNKDKEVKRIMVALDITETIADEAVEKNVDMIITHHPLIFNPIKNITMDNAKGRIIHKLISNNISLYCSHTNLDMANEGTNDLLARRVDLKEIKSFISTKEEKYFKLVVFVPEDHLEAVRSAMGEGGAGHIGNYSCCTFSARGTGTFMPKDGANPYIGSVDDLEKVNEYRLETIVSKDNMSTVIDKMIEAHPYEEVAYDIISLENKFNKYGLGRIGSISPKKLSLFSEEVKRKLDLKNVKIVGNPDKIVSIIGVCSGSGATFIDDAYRMGCDCFITGDVKYHDAQYALELGLAIIDAGHFETENIICETLVEQLNTHSKEKGLDYHAFQSTTNLNPFVIL